MSYDLHAKNKQISNLSIGCFSWPILLQETGAGYILGYGASRCPAQYVYQTGGHGSPVSNDGYIVTSSESKMMARIIRGYISVKKFVNKEWDEMSEEDRNHSELMNERMKIYTPYTSEKLLNILEKIAEFAEKSGGFRIY